MSAGQASAHGELAGVARNAAGLFRGVFARVWAAVRFVWNWVFGAILCLSPPGALLAVGWCMRFMQRATYRRWWSMSGKREPFDVVMRRMDQADSSQTPNWILDQRAWEKLSGASALGRILALPKTLIRSLVLNFKFGFFALLNVGLLTLPAGVLWVFAWNAGWNNSFHKGYEQAWIGPTTGILGILLFSIVMLYVPVAQARQAATGSWRAFFDYRVVRAVIRERWAASAWLALGFALCGVPVLIARTAPMFFGNDPAYDAMSDQAIREALLNYWFWMSMWLFPAYVVLRLAAARIYATAVPRLLEREQLATTDLHPTEVRAMEALALGQPSQAPGSAPLVRAIRWSGSRALRITARAAAFACWVGVAAQVFIGEFFNVHPLTGWLNLPLIHLPWIASFPG